MKFLLFLLSSLLACAAPVTAQSLLMVVQETLNGSPLPAPLSSREGLAAALFEDGYIVFDLPGGAPSTVELLNTASAAGADYVLELRIDFSSTATVVPRVEGHAAFTLRKAAGGETVLKGTLDGTNRDRDNTVDRSALGLEMGGAIAEKVRELLSRPGR